MRAILIDADGVVIKFEHNFAECYSEQFNVPIDSFFEFFEKDYQPCALGRADIREAIKKYIPRWKWDGSVDELIDFWYSCQGQLDQGVLNVISAVRSARIPCYLATDQDRLRANHLTDGLGLRHHFDGFFFSCDLGFTKADSSFFRRTVDLLGCLPGDLLLWDDSLRNVEAARGAGLNAELYVNSGHLQEKMNALFSLPDAT